MPVIRVRHRCDAAGQVWDVYQCPACGRVWELWPDLQWRRVIVRAWWWRLTGQI